MQAEQAILETAYAAFNARDIDAVLALMHPDVDWPNGWEGGWLHGRDAVRQYWIRQWAVLDPRVEPVAFRFNEPGRVVVEVHQVVRERDGKLVADQMVQHIYRIEDGLVRSMEIRQLTP